MGREVAIGMDDSWIQREPSVGVIVVDVIPPMRQANLSIR